MVTFITTDGVEVTPEIKTLGHVDPFGGLEYHITLSLRKYHKNEGLRSNEEPLIIEAQGVGLDQACIAFVEELARFSVIANRASDACVVVED